LLRAFGRPYQHTSIIFELKTATSSAMKTIHFLSGAGTALLLFVCLSTVKAQQVRHVPSDYATIQQAIHAAQTGDTVLVAPGTYQENIQLQGRDIVLTSRYYLDAHPTAVVQQTIIDGSAPTHPDTASCLLICRAETAATVIQGFTFRGGKGTVWLDPEGAGTFREGGGILTEGSSPVIRHNIIRDNVVTPGGSGLVSTGGGGIRCGAGAVRLENNYIVHNRADGYGGGVVLNYCPDAVLRNNIIAHNTGGADYSGGGFWATGKDQNTINVLQHNTIAFNQSLAATGQLGGKAGGVWVFSITLKMENNIVWGNNQSTGEGIGSANANLQLLYNCIENGIGGTGTMTTNPMFRDSFTLVLEAGSPSIDAGVGTSDVSRNQRRAAFPARGTLTPDLGAYGGASIAIPAPAYLQPTSIFSKVQQSPVVQTPGDSRSVNWVDIDNDFDLDLFITNGPQGGENNLLYQNNGAGAFTPITDQPIVQDNAPSDGATWADYDNDGDVDCYVVNWYGVNNLFYKNNGGGQFEQVLTGAFVTNGGYSETASWGDYNKDGLVDLYVTNSGGNKRNFLYQNQGNGTLVRITTGAAVTDAATSRSVNWVDFDLDGDADLFVTNENNESEQLYRNEDGVLVKVTGIPLVSAGASTMSASWGDCDNDGDLDVFLANDQGNDAIFRQDNGSFVPVVADPAVTSGGNSFGSQWADVDNDGDLDLFVTNAFWGGLWRNFLFFNRGDGTFERNETEVVTADQGWSYGCAFGDFDRDGDLDLGVANCYNASQTDYLYENHSAENTQHWLGIRCIGTVSNRSAIGALVWVYSTVDGQQKVQLRDISAQSGYCGQNQLEVHVGLGHATHVDSVVVHWPAGSRERFLVAAMDQYITVTESAVTNAVSERIVRHLPIQVLPNPFGDTVTVRWEMPSNGAAQLEILDVLGKTVYTRVEHVAAGIQEWVCTGWKTPGQYLLRLSGAGWMGVTQIIGK
jgi:enediyne biosynthesis protein E4